MVLALENNCFFTDNPKIIQASKFLSKKKKKSWKKKVGKKFKKMNH